MWTKFEDSKWTFVKQIWISSFMNCVQCFGKILIQCQSFDPMSMFIFCFNFAPLIIPPYIVLGNNTEQTSFVNMDLFLKNFPI